jgi:hypothetical protein
MGRPVNKRYFGDYDTGTQLRVAAHTGNGAVDTSYIIAQKGTNQFRVTDGTTELECRLVDKATGSVLLGEMVIFGTAAGVNDRLPIKKLFNRTATDFDGNRYSWEIQNDSTQTLLVLTSF